MQIMPISEFKNTDKIIKTCKENDNPLFITNNGYGELAIMSMKAYKEQQEELLIFKRLINAYQGNTVSATEVNDEIRKIYE